jgi:hypothetical protein
LKAAKVIRSRLKHIRCVRWKSYEPNILPCQHSHHLLVNRRRTVIAKEKAGKIIGMHGLAPGIEIFEGNFSDIFLENRRNHGKRVVGTDKKVMPIPLFVFPNGIIDYLPVDDRERHPHITRH